MPGKKGMKHYPPAIKEQAVRMHLEDKLTVKQVNSIFGISDEQRLKKWCAKYRKNGLDGLLYSSKGRPRKRERTCEEQLRYENRRLHMENEVLRNFLYEVARG